LCVYQAGQRAVCVVCCFFLCHLIFTFAAMPDTSSSKGHEDGLSQAEANAIVAAGGHFLGASEGFWIVFACCVGGVLLTLFVVIGAVTLQTRRRVTQAEEDESEDEEEQKDLPTDPLPNKPSPDPGFLQRVVFNAGKYGDGFAFNADLSLRAAFLSLLCASTYFIPALSWWQSNGWEMSYVIVLLGFTVYLDLGTTVFLAWSGFYGTLLSVANCWLLFGLYPNGTSSDNNSEAMLFGYVNFFVFVWLMFGLNFATNAKMFGLSWQAYFSMCFLNPGDRSVFSRGLWDIQLHAGETGALMGTIWGCGFALLCVLVPTCMSALGKAQDLALETAWTHGRLLQHVLEHSIAKGGRQETSTFGAEVKKLREHVKQMEPHLANSWWECFDLGIAGRSKARLSKLCTALEVLTDWAEASILAVEQVFEQSENGQDHARLLSKLQPELYHLSSVAGLLLRVCASIAVQGRADDRQDQVQDLLGALGKEESQLAARCQAERQQLPQRGFSLKTVPELALAYSLSGYSRQVAAHAAELLEEDDTWERRGLLCSFLYGICALFPGLSELQSWKYYAENLKLMTTFLACFFVGMYGIGCAYGVIIPTWSSTAGGTVAYLIFQGGNKAAALKKNADRFMGVGLGTLMGQLILGSACSVSQVLHAPWLFYALLLIVFALFFASFYTYFASPNFGYVGLLVACFFADQLGKCSVMVGSSLNNYEILMAQLLAIIVASLMDVLADSTQSIKATEVLAEFGSLLETALKTFETKGSSSEDAVHFHRPEGLALLSSASSAGDVAGKEPRILRLPWRAELWENLMDYCSEAWRCVSLLEYTAAEGGAHGGKVRKAVAVLLTSPAYRREIQQLQLRASRSFNLSKRFLMHDYLDHDLPMEALEMQLLESHKLSLREKHQVITEVGAVLPTTPASVSSLVDDQLCEVAMILTMTEALAVRLAKVETVLVQQPEMWLLME